jgi:O-antigen/teichoic acid export membrane protein
MTIDGDGAPAPEGVPPPEGIPPPGELGLPGDTGPTRSVARNMGALLSSQIVTWLLATILVWFVPRYLGAESFGEFRLASSIWLIAGIIAQFGTSTLTTIEVARHRTSARSFVRHVIRVRLVLLAIVAPVVIGIFVVGPYSRSTLEVGVIVGVGAIVTMFLTAFESGLHGLQEMGRSASAHVVTKFAATVLTIVVLLAGGRLIPMAIVYVAGSALTMTLFAGRRQRGDRLVRGCRHAVRLVAVRAGHRGDRPVPGHGRPARQGTQ